MSGATWQPERFRAIHSGGILRRMMGGQAAVRPEVVRPALREVLIVAGLYLAYTSSRLLADDHLAPALRRANHILHVERWFRLDVEQALNEFFAAHAWVGLAADYWYATAHYVGTAAVLVWLYRRGRGVYVPARRALIYATVAGLVCYLLMPTAPPRLSHGYLDVMSMYAGDGWWGADASAPRGLGGPTNELAAFPSLHAGWSLWVALAVSSATRARWACVAGFAYAATTAIVVVGTANHWVADVLIGWAVVLVGWALSRRRGTPPKAS